MATAATPTEHPRVTVNDPSQATTPEVPTSETKSGKAGKKPKKPKLTKAERKALKAAKALELKKFLIRDHLRRELEMSRKSAKRGKEQWEDLCKEIKILELKDEVTAWNVKTQRLMQQKDDKITRMLDDMGTTQEMHKRNFEKHLQVLDYIISCYSILVNASKQLYESESQQMIEDFFEELNAKQEIQNRIRFNCENIMHATNMVVEEQLRNDFEIFLEKQDDRVNREIEQRYNLRDNVICKMRLLRQQLLDFVASLTSFSLDTKKYERIHMLMDKQRQFLVESHRLNELEFRLTRTHGDLQREQVHIEVDAQRKTSDLRLEQAYFLQVRKGIERNIALDHHITFEKLKALTGTVYGIIKEFQKFVKYGELLLSLAANCRKLQTESEKVVAYDDDEDGIPDEFTLHALDLKSHVDLTEKELAAQMKLMRNFWRRQALVEAENLVLLEEKKKLLAENQKYIDFIKLMSKKENIDGMEATLTVTLLIPDQDVCSQKLR